MYRLDLAAYQSDLTLCFDLKIECVTWHDLHCSYLNLGCIYLHKVT